MMGQRGDRPPGRAGFRLLFAPQMVEVIHWCIELGVQHISVYAFSIDNFKRAPEEVSALMHLAEDKYNELAKVSPRRGWWWTCIACFFA